MPQVPVPGRQIEQRPTDATPLRPQNVGAGAMAVAQGLGMAGRHLQAAAFLGDRADQLKDQADAKLADDEYQRFRNSLLNDPTQGYFRLNGKNAIDRRQDVTEQLAQKRQELAGNLRSPRAAAMANAVLGDRFGIDIERINTFAAKQAEVYEAQASAARLATTIQSAVHDHTDKALFARHLETAMGEVASQAQLNGWAPETAAQERLKALTAIHAGVADQIADTDPAAALAYIQEKAAAAQIDTVTADKMADALRPAVEAREAVSIADDIRGVATAAAKNMPRDDDLTSRLAEVDRRAKAENWTPEKAARVKQHVQQGVALDQRLLADMRSRAAEEAWGYIDAGKSVPPSLMAQVSPSQRRALHNAAEAEGAGGGFARVSNNDHLNAARDMATFEPHRFVQIDLNEVRGQFSKSDWNALREMQRRIEAGKGQNIAITKVTSIVRPLMEAAGLSTTGQKGSRRKATADRIAAYQTAVMKDVEAYTLRHRELPDEETIREIGTRQLTQMQVWDPDALFAHDEGSVLYFERGTVKPGRQVRYDAADIAVPDSFRDRFAKTYMAETGRAPSEAEIARAFMALGVR